MEEIGALPSTADVLQHHGGLAVPEAHDRRKVAPAWVTLLTTELWHMTRQQVPGEESLVLSFYLH